MKTKVGLVVMLVLVVLLGAVSSATAGENIKELWWRTWSESSSCYRDRGHHGHYGCPPQGGYVVVGGRRVKVVISGGLIGDIISAATGPREVVVESPVVIERERIVEVPVPVLVGRSEEALTIRIQRQQEVLRQEEIRQQREQVDRLLERVKSRDPDERLVAIRGLANFPPERRIRETLVKRLETDPSALVRLEVVLTFSKTQEREALNALKKAEGDLDERVSAAAKRTVEEIGLADLFARLDSENKEDRKQAVEDLAKVSYLDQDKKLEILEQFLLEDLDPEVRKEAAKALGVLKSEKSLPALEKAKADPNKDVREEVKEAAKKIKEAARERERRAH